MSEAGDGQGLSSRCEPKKIKKHLAMKRPGDILRAPFDRKADGQHSTEPITDASPAQE